jgi:protein tyrosine/serine phosphatase
MNIIALKLYGIAGLLPGLHDRSVIAYLANLFNVMPYNEGSYTTQPRRPNSHTRIIQLLQTLLRKELNARLVLRAHAHH